VFSRLEGPRPARWMWSMNAEDGPTMKDNNEKVPSSMI